MIEVGEYVRSNLGSIGKVTKIEDGKFLYENKCLICFISNVVKHSSNIIDLIEEGDYVNGLEVYKGKVASGKEKLLVGNHIINGMALEIVNIKTLVTKEQFSSVEYRLE